MKMEKQILASSVEGVIVSKSNSLIRAAQNLSRHEAIIINMIITQLDSKAAKGSECNQKMFSVSPSELAAACRITESTARKHLNSAYVDLFERCMNIPCGKIKEGGFETMSVRWLQKRAKEKNGTVYFQFTNDALEYLTELGDCFTTYPLEQVLQLNKEPSFYLYELAQEIWGKQCRHSGNKKSEVISITELKNQFGFLDKDGKDISNSTKKGNYVLNRILIPASEDCNDKTDILIKIEARNSKNINKKVGPGTKIDQFKITVSQKKTREEMCDEYESKHKALVTLKASYSNIQSVSPEAAEHMKPSIAKAERAFKACVAEFTARGMTEPKILTAI